MTMPKFNVQAVSPKYKGRDYGRWNVVRSRAQRALENTPAEFTLDIRLVIELRDGRLRNCSTTQSRFLYSHERMRWENIDPIDWQCTLHCTAVALDFLHPALGSEPIFRQLVNVDLDLGVMIRFDPGSIQVSDDVFANIKLPHEDFVINEEPDLVDWQKQLAGSLAKPRFARRRKSKPS